MILVAGGYRTGSTLQYNLIGEYLEHSGLGRRGGYLDPDGADRFVADCRDAFAVVKCHQIAAGFHTYDHPGAWGEAVRRGDVVALLTERDASDVERSMCRKFGIARDALHASEIWRENEANLALWRPLADSAQHYDDLTRRPRQSLMAVLRQVGVPVRGRSVRYAVEASSVERMQRHQRDVPTGTWDPVTLIHWDHIAD